MEIRRWVEIVAFMQMFFLVLVSCLVFQDVLVFHRSSFQSNAYVIHLGLPACIASILFNQYLSCA